MHIVTRRYQGKPGSMEEVVPHLNKVLLPIMSKAPGFIEYYAVDMGNDVLVTISVFETKAGTDESTRIASDYVKQYFTHLMTAPPEIMEGNSVAHQEAHKR